MLNLETTPFLLAALPVERLAVVWQMVLAALPVLVILAALLAVTGLAAGLLLNLVLHGSQKPVDGEGSGEC